jgi:hypothetical protein
VGPLTVRATKTLNVLFPETIATAPSYVPPVKFAMMDAFTETLRVALPPPEVGFTASHAPPELVEAVAVKLCGAVTAMFWAVGAATLVEVV